MMSGQRFFGVVQVDLGALPVECLREQDS